MNIRACGALLVLGLGLGLTSSASSQTRPSIAIMPTQYFSADAQSAANVTAGLREQFERQGYTVTDAGRSTSTFESMQLGASTHYPDSVARRFGQTAGADLVAYPRLLAVGLPAATTGDASLLEPAAVVHLRVINVKTGAPIYFRQIAHEFRADSPGENVAFQLPEPVATASASEVTQMYFARVAGSREESGTRK
jgi:hypothetical protein